MGISEYVKADLDGMLRRKIKRELLSQEFLAIPVFAIMGASLVFLLAIVLANSFSGFGPEHHKYLLPVFGLAAILFYALLYSEYRDGKETSKIEYAVSLPEIGRILDMYVDGHSKTKIAQKVFGSHLMGYFKCGHVIDGGIKYARMVERRDKLKDELNRESNQETAI